MILRRFLASPIIALLILAAIVLMSLWVFRAYQELLTLRREEGALRQKFEVAEMENQRLRNEIRIARTPEAIERDAKSRLNLKKPGEEVVVVIPPPLTEESGTSAEVSFWERFFQWFRSLIR